MNIRDTRLGSLAQNKDNLANLSLMEKIVSIDPIAVLQYKPSKHMGREKYQVIKSPSDLSVRDNQVTADELMIWLATIPVPLIIYEKKDKKHTFEIYSL